MVVRCELASAKRAPRMASPSIERRDATIGAVEGEAGGCGLMKP